VSWDSTEKATEQSRLNSWHRQKYFLRHHVQPSIQRGDQFVRLTSHFLIQPRSKSYGTTSAPYTCFHGVVIWQRFLSFLCLLSDNLGLRTKPPPTNVGEIRASLNLRLRCDRYQTVTFVYLMAPSALHNLVCSC
jgi:hypothetical protein